MNVIGPLERRLDEIVIGDPKLKQLIEQLLECSKRAFAIAPQGGPQVRILGLPPTPQEHEDSRKRGEVAERARECEEIAVAALRRMSELRAKAEQ